jgi:hypothetical protein
LAPQIYKGSTFPLLFSMSGLNPEIKNNYGESIGATMSPELLRIAQGSEMTKLIHTYYWGKQIAASKGTPHGDVIPFTVPGSPSNGETFYDKTVKRC